VTLYALRQTESSAGDFRLKIDDCLLQAGRIYSIAGPNGSGKTTLLNLLAFLREPSGGRIFFKGNIVDYADRAGLLRLRRRVGYLMQNPYLFNMSVYDNIAYGLKVRAVPGDELRARVEAIMARLSLSPLAKRNAHRISGGEAQRVALARTLVLNAAVVLLDEPTANVDRASVRAVEEAVLRINRETNTTVILTTHSEDQAFRMSRHRLCIIKGRVSGVAYENVFEGTVHEASGGVRTVVVSGETAFTIAGAVPGRRATVAIDPEDIILSENRFSSSALNVFKGTISRIDDADGTVRVFVNVGEISLCAVLTRKSLAAMGLTVGRNVWLTFKASAVKVL